MRLPGPELCADFRDVCSLFTVPAQFDSRQKSPFHLSSLNVINLPHRQKDPEIARVRVVPARSETVVVIQPALSTSAVGVRAAYLPGSAATAFPSTGESNAQQGNEGPACSPYWSELRLRGARSGA